MFDSEIKSNVIDNIAENKSTAESVSKDGNHEEEDAKSEDSSFDEDNDLLLSEIIQFAMPKGKISQDKNLAEKISRQIEMDRKAEGSEMRQNVVTNSSNEKNPKQNKNQMLPKTFKPERTSSHINQSNQDHMCTYATEDTTNNFSTIPSNTKLPKL